MRMRMMMIIMPISPSPFQHPWGGIRPVIRPHQFQLMLVSSFMVRKIWKSTLHENCTKARTRRGKSSGRGGSPAHTREVPTLMLGTARTDHFSHHPKQEKGKC
jgi:hypothetical protein